MIDTRLIVLDGIAGSGKSTTAQKLYRCLHLDGVEAEFYHEFHGSHPIFEVEVDKSESWIEGTHLRWRQFVERQESLNRVSLLDGALFQVGIGELLEADLDEDEIENYVSRVETIIAPLQPCLIYLFQSDVEAAVRDLWQLRPESWRQRVVSTFENSPYGHECELKGFELYLDFVKRQSKLADRCFDRLKLNKLKLKTGADRWDDLAGQIGSFLGLPNKSDPFEPDEFVGEYADPKSGRRCVICNDSGDLRAEDLFPIAKSLLPKRRDTMFVGSWPDELTFERDDGGRVTSFRSTGTWNRIGDGVWTRIDSA